MAFWFMFLEQAKDPATNGTAVVVNTYEAGYYWHNLHVSGLFVLCAAAFCFFVVLTMHMLDRGRSLVGTNKTTTFLHPLTHI